MRQLLTVTKSVARLLARPSDGVGIRSTVHPQKVPTICHRCALTTDVLSGPPNSEVVRTAKCGFCKNEWKCTVMRGEL